MNLFKKKSISELYCLEHQNEIIRSVCVDKQCYEKKLVCYECLKSDQSHLTHRNNLININDLEQWIDPKIIKCKTFCDNIDKITIKIQQLIRTITKKYLIRKDRLQQLTSKQLNNLIESFIKQDQFIQFTEATLYEKQNSLIQEIEIIIDELNISNLNYIELTKDEYQQSENYYKQGVDLYKQRNYQDAIIKFNSVIEINNQNFQAFHGKGCSLRLLGQYQESITQYNKSLEINPNFINSIYCIGESLWLLGKYEESLQWNNKSLQIDQNYTLTRLIESFYCNGDSIQFLKKQEEPSYLLIPNFFELLMKGERLRIQNQLNESLEFINGLINRYPRCSEFLIQKGTVLRQQHQYIEALDVLNKALSIKNSNIFAKELKGLIIQEMNQA